jgi:hypothetical protein
LILSGLLLVLACDKKSEPSVEATPQAPEAPSDPPPSDPPLSDVAPAGKVLSIEGQATATRPGQAARKLDADAPVYADDMLRTELASRVELHLDHNGARYELGPDREIRLEASIAWRAKRLDSGVFDETPLLKSAAAGRNTERDAADTKATLDRAKTDGNVSAVLETESPDKDEEAADTNVNNEIPETKIPEPEEPSLSSGSETFRVIGKKPGRLGKASKGEEDRSSSGRKTLPSQEDVILEQAKACKQTHGGSGSFYLAVSVDDFIVIEIVTLGPKDLEATLSCLKKKLSDTKMPHDESVTGTLAL